MFKVRRDGQRRGDDADDGDRKAALGVGDDEDDDDEENPDVQREDAAVRDGGGRPLTPVRWREIWTLIIALSDVRNIGKLHRMSKIIRNIRQTRKDQVLPRISGIYQEQ